MTIHSEKICQRAIFQNIGLDILEHPLGRVVLLGIAGSVAKQSFKAAASRLTITGCRKNGVNLRIQGTQDELLKLSSLWIKRKR